MPSDVWGQWLNHVSVVLTSPVTMATCPSGYAESSRPMGSLQPSRPIRRGVKKIICQAIPSLRRGRLSHFSAPEPLIFEPQTDSEVSEGSLPWPGHIFTLNLHWKIKWRFIKASRDKGMQLKPGQYFCVLINSHLNKNYNFVWALETHPSEDFMWNPLDQSGVRIEVSRK